MNAANSLPFTPNTNAGAHPHTPRGLSKEQALNSMVDWLTRAGFSAAIKGDAVEVQDPYQLSTGGKPPVLRFEAKLLRDMASVHRFISARS